MSCLETIPQSSPLPLWVSNGNKLEYNDFCCDTGGFHQPVWSSPGLVPTITRLFRETVPQGRQKRFSLGTGTDVSTDKIGSVPDPLPSLCPRMADPRWEVVEDWTVLCSCLPPFGILDVHELRRVHSRLLGLLPLSQTSFGVTDYEGFNYVGLLGETLSESEVSLSSSLSPGYVDLSRTHVRCNTLCWPQVQDRGGK